MKYALFMIMCSAFAGECMPPYEMKTKYDTMYDCLNAGYEESLVKSKEIGRQEVNKHHIYIKFICKEKEVIVPPPKPKVKA